MLKLNKETLTELTPDQMSAVVGAVREYAVSAVGGADACLTIAIRHPESCVALSCITND